MLLFAAVSIQAHRFAAKFQHSPFCLPILLAYVKYMSQFISQLCSFHVDTVATWELLLQYYNLESSTVQVKAAAAPVCAGAVKACYTHVLNVISGCTGLCSAKEALLLSERRAISCFMSCMSACC